MEEDIAFMKAKALDKKFDEGKDISKHLDMSRAQRASGAKPPRSKTAIPTAKREKKQGNKAP